MIRLIRNKMNKTIRTVGYKANFPGKGYGPAMSIPKGFHLEDNLNINAEHMVCRTTVGGSFDYMFNIMKRWLRFLSKAVMCWMLAILFLINDIPVVAFPLALLGGHFFGMYKVWRERFMGRFNVSALVPLL